MWSNIIGQERIKEILKNFYKSGKLSHAFIFYGNEGTGKDAAAIEFAKLLNCDSPLNGSEACDSCKSCIETDSLKSQMLRFVTALPAGKNDSDDDSNPLEKLEKEDFENYLSEIELKAEDKYHTVSIPKANDIRISSIRQLKKEIYMTGRSGKKKVFLISRCEMMNTQSANSLLKILEEPPNDSVIILTTSRINSLLPTIVGRCQSIRFDVIPNNKIITYIKQKSNAVTDENAAFIAGISEGSISKCNQLLNNNYLDLREKVIDTLVSILSGHSLKLGNSIDFIIGKKDKARIKNFLVFLIIWFRDIINISSGNGDQIINRDKKERLISFAGKYDSDNYMIISSIEDAITDIEKNVIPELILYNLFFSISSLMKKKSDLTAPHTALTSKNPE
ncbi:MAG TPA: hypothetical protein PK536_00175 [Ignavibacteria bacterium]|nr:hypothetical protein [Bacteroidota bacterium]HRI83839.1 hypothetical protein [Ignavibacteria bacterium]HRJ99970.1 hypothetical protein [Ignavibacteria bacterium]